MMLIAGVIVGAMFLMGGAYRLMENSVYHGTSQALPYLYPAGISDAVRIRHRYRGADPGRGHDPEA